MLPDDLDLFPAIVMSMLTFSLVVRSQGLDGQGRRLASGVYLLRFQAGSRWETRKVVAAR